MRIPDKVAIVTGGANGIGRAIALRFAEEGADVVIADIDVEKANNVVQKIEALGRRGLAIKTDVSRIEEAEAMAETALNAFGKIDILINDAGGGAGERGSLFHESKEDVWDYVIGINLKGTRNCTRAVINHMIERKYGKIVSIASCAGILGDEHAVDYSAAKAGIIGFTFALAKEVTQHGIYVNSISPGPIGTEKILNRTPTERSFKLMELTGMGRRGEPEEVAAMALFLVSDEASFITGQNYPVCGLRNLGGA